MNDNLKKMLETFVEFCEHGKLPGYEQLETGTKLSAALIDARYVLAGKEPKIPG